MSYFWMGFYGVLGAWTALVLSIVLVAVGGLLWSLATTMLLPPHWRR